MRDGTPLPEAAPTVSQLEPGVILDIARWANFEEDSLWHNRLARVLASGDHEDEAIEHYRIALDLNDERLDACAGLVECYMSKERYKTAIEIQRKAEKILETRFGRPSGYHKSWKEHYQRDTFLYDSLGQIDLALESCQKTLRVDPDSSAMSQFFLLLLGPEGRHHEIMVFLKELHADVIPKTGLSRLVQFPDHSYIFHDSLMYSIAIRAARKTRDIGLIRENLLASIKSARTTDKVGQLLCHLGLLFKQDYRDEPNAVRVWNHVVRLSQNPLSSSDLRSAGLEASRNLAISYFDRALEAEKDSIHQKSCIQLLESLATGLPSSKVEIVEEGLGYAYTTHDTSLVLGYLYQMIGRESSARACFATHVRLAVDLLTDDTTDNDLQGYQILFSVFIKIKDDDNTLAAMSLSFLDMLHNLDEAAERESHGTDRIEGDNKDDSSGEDDRHSGSTEGAASEELSANFDEGQNEQAIACDECGCGFQDSDLHICRVCYDLGFCGDCIKLVKEGRTKILQCSPKHEFLCLPSPLNKPPEGYVKYKDRDIPVTTWIEQIKREWRV